MANAKTIRERRRRKRQQLRQQGLSESEVMQRIPPGDIPSAFDRMLGRKELPGQMGWDDHKLER